MKPQELQSRAIEILRFPLSVMVVSIHCYYFKTQNINQLHDTLLGGVMDWIMTFFSIIITDCAVPMFFVISGYLYFIKQVDYTWKEHVDKIKKKCITLMLPFFIWNMIGVIANPMPFIHASLAHKIIGFWSTRFQYGSLSGPWDDPLWFVRDLFIVMLFAPLISRMIKKYGLILPGLFLILYCLEYKAICPGLSSVSFLFFSLGAFLAIRVPQFSSHLTKRTFTVVFVIALLLFGARVFTITDLARGLSLGRYINTMWIFASMTAYFCLAIIIAKSANMIRWKRLGASSFVVFAMHSLIIGKISSTFLFLVGKPNVGNWLTIVFYFSTIILSCIICYYTHVLMSKNAITSKLFEGSRNR